MQLLAWQAVELCEGPMPKRRVMPQRTAAASNPGPKFHWAMSKDECDVVPKEEFASAVVFLTQFMRLTLDNNISQYHVALTSLQEDLEQAKKLESHNKAQERR